MCSCLRCLCPLSMCLRLLSSVFVPTLHSITLFLPLSLYFETIRIFVNFVYARVCVQSLCLCNLYFYQTVPFCPLCLSAIVCLSVCPLFSLPTVSVSDQISLCPLCLYCSCQLSVFVSSLVGVCDHSASARSVYSWCSCPFYFTPRPMNLLFQACAGMWTHILVHAFCKIINWIIYQLCRCILQFTRLAVHSIWTPDLHFLMDQLLWKNEIWPIRNEHDLSRIACHGGSRLIFLKPRKGLWRISIPLRRKDGRTDRNLLCYDILWDGMIQIDPGYCIFLSRSHKFQRRTERMDRRTDRKAS